MVLLGAAVILAFPVRCQIPSALMVSIAHNASLCAPQTHPLANTLKPEDIVRPTIGVNLSLATRPSILAGESSVT